MYYRYWMHNHNHHHVPVHYVIRTDRWKLIYCYNQPLSMTGSFPNNMPPEWEYFDMKNDPREIHNLYSDPKYAHLIRHLKQQMAKTPAGSRR
jgi:arylsulfatase A-like enzyme